VVISGSTLVAIDGGTFPVPARPGTVCGAFRFSAEIIIHCVWLNHRFPLSFREVEEMMLQRFFRTLLTGLQYVPRVVITDKLGSYQAARRKVTRSVEHRQSKYLNTGRRTHTNRPGSANAR
jgi:transposase-like protein